MNLYRQGFRFEKRVQEKLEALGYYVIRSAGSHGSVDIVAFPGEGAGKILLIQCKHSKAEKLELKTVLNYKDVRQLTQLPIDTELSTKIEYCVFVKRKRSQHIVQLFWRYGKWVLDQII